MKNVFIITEGNNQIGYGHVFRSISLLEILKDQFTCHLLLIKAPKDISVNVKYNNFESPQGIIENLKNTANENDIVVIDSYNFPNSFIEEIKKIKLTTVSVNDLPEKSLNTDIIINHTLNIDESLFRVNPNTKLLLGEKYMLLRKAFLKEKIQKKSHSEKEKIFLCFGGADPFGLSLRYLDYLNRMKVTSEVIILTNSQKTFKDIGNFIEHRGMNNVKAFRAVDEFFIIEQLKASKIAILPSSSIVLEALCIGVNLLTGFYVDNQKILAENISQLGLGFNAGNLNQLSFEKFSAYFFNVVNSDFVTRQKEYLNSNSMQYIITEFKNLNNG